LETELKKYDNNGMIKKGKTYIPAEKAKIVLEVLRKESQ